MPNVKKRPEKDCPTCGSRFSCVHPKQKYCSRKCIQAPGRKHLVCPCGVNTGSYQRRYCSPEHRALYGKKKPPTRMVDHTCLGCGRVFQRPWNYPSKGKYCSNACAHREQKMTTEVGALLSNDRTIIFRSGWEIRYWAVCLRRDIPIRSYDGPDIETSQGIYRPDFIVGDGTVVDVKGWMRPESHIKIEESRTQGVEVTVVDKAALLALEQGAPHDLDVAEAQDQAQDQARDQ